jgi:hypothetical protein
MPCPWRNASRRTARRVPPGRHEAPIRLQHDAKMTKCVAYVNLGTGWESVRFARHEGYEETRATHYVTCVDRLCGGMRDP